MCAGGRSVVAVYNSSNRKRNKPLIFFLIQMLAKEQEKGKHSSVTDSTMGRKSARDERRRQIKETECRRTRGHKGLGGEEDVRG